jgi:glycosyltransferase involved in cell wall biosynthesis
MLAYLSTLVPEQSRARVEFAGHLTQDQLLKKYHQARVCVFPSRDGFGLVPAEAMACGKPIVVSDVMGSRDVITDGETGLVARGDDPASLACAVDRLLSDTLLREKIGAAAQQFAREHFHGSVVAKSMVDVYRVVLSGT